MMQLIQDHILLYPTFQSIFLDELYTLMKRIVLAGIFIKNDCHNNKQGFILATSGNDSSKSNGNGNDSSNHNGNDNHSNNDNSSGNDNGKGNGKGDSNDSNNDGSKNNNSGIGSSKNRIKPTSALSSPSSPKPTMLISGTHTLSPNKITHTTHAVIIMRAISNARGQQRTRTTARGVSSARDKKNAR